MVRAFPNAFCVIIRNNVDCEPLTALFPTGPLYKHMVTVAAAFKRTQNSTKHNNSARKIKTQKNNTDCLIIKTLYGHVWCQKAVNNWFK